MAFYVSFESCILSANGDLNDMGEDTGAGDNFDETNTSASIFSFSSGTEF